jgi:hypothetical protein
MFQLPTSRTGSLSPTEKERNKTERLWLSIKKIKNIFRYIRKKKVRSLDIRST